MQQQRVGDLDVNMTTKNSQIRYTQTSGCCLCALYNLYTSKVIPCVNETTSTTGSKSNRWYVWFHKYSTKCRERCYKDEIKVGFNLATLYTGVTISDNLNFYNIHWSPAVSRAWCFLTLSATGSNSAVVLHTLLFTSYWWRIPDSSHTFFKFHQIQDVSYLPKPSRQLILEASPVSLRLQNPNTKNIFSSAFIVGVNQ